MPVPDKRRITFDYRKSVAENARRSLPALARRFLVAGTGAAAADAQPETLHQFRLQAKRFRYTIELFQCCYGPGLETRLSRLRRLQQMLGQMSDCATTHQLVASSSAHSAQDESLATFLDALARRRTTEFQRYWKNKFEGEEQQKWWTEYLRRPARALAAKAAK